MFGSTGRRAIVLTLWVVLTMSALAILPASGDSSVGVWQAGSAADRAYWTTDRMQRAAPVEQRIAPDTATPDPSSPMASQTPVPPSPSSVKASPNSVKQGVSSLAAPANSLAAPANVQGKFYTGIPVVGTFFADTAAGDTTCTGSVVHSPNKNLVLSAGHCLKAWRSNGAHRIFVPQYTAGRDAAHQPFGFFPVDAVFVDPRYSPPTAISTLTDLDFGFAQLDPNDGGTQIEDVTGALTLKTTPGYRNNVTVLGYPTKAHNANGQTWSCAVTTAALPGYHQMQMGCPGFYGGTSGGPWIANYNATAHTGDVIGETGGVNGGGDTDAVSYSPMFDQQIQLLYNDAVSGAVTSRPAYAALAAPGALPGTPAMWKGARLLASGDYSSKQRSDLITVWTDGKVSLFPALAAGGYGAEKVLAAANARWKNARLITGGDFDGKDTFDLLVVWKDGKLSNFVDTTPARLGAEKKYTGSTVTGLNSAAQITAGKFGSPYVTDLVVLWKDGELSLYSNSGGGKFGAEHQLKKANPTWKQATLFSSGQYKHATTWDLLVRWTDGEVDNYPAVSSRGLGAEHRILNSNARWRNAAAITTGHYTANAYTDDLLVRWADGNTTLYPDSTIDHLGSEQPLVK